MTHYHAFHPSLTPPPDYWEVVDEKPAVPPKSDRRPSSSSDQVFTPIPSLPPVPPRYFPLRPYETPIKPLPRPPRDLPQSLQITSLEPTKRSVSSPAPMPASPTPSIRSLNSEASSTSSTTSIPARYRHRANSSVSSTAGNSGVTSLSPFPSISMPSSPTSPQFPRPRGLRRMRSPPRESLRTLRARESEACLKAAYDRQLNAYLDGSIALGAFGMSGLDGIEE